MIVTIVHDGGSRKTVTFECFDAPRPWARLRYPNGGGLFSFALAHGCIECKRGEHPRWRLLESELEQLRAMAAEEKVKFKPIPFERRAQARPRAPKKPTPQKNLELFPGAE